MNAEPLRKVADRGRRAGARSRAWGWLMLAVMIAFPAVAQAQLASAAAGLALVRTVPRVHVECAAQVPCNLAALSEAISWVEWVDAPGLAQVLVSIEAEAPTEGGDGRVLAFRFQGADAMAHLSDELTFAAPADMEPAAVSAGIERTLTLGLLRYGVEGGLGTDFALTPSPRLLAAASSGAANGAGSTGEAQAAYDPWNYWQFRAGLGGNVDIRERESTIRLNPSLGADRVTENWKVNLSFGFDVDRRTTTIPATETNPGREVVDNRDSWNASALIVKSISGHMSTGIDVSAGNSVRNNQRTRVLVAPGIEWNYYPYAETNRRQLIAHYAAGVQYNDYTEETIFGETRETLPLHKIGVQYRASESWGNAGVSLNASQYLHSTGFYSFGASGNLSLRIVRGLDLSLNASGGKIADQLYLPESNLSEEDILLGRRALPTGYDYQFSVGLNYRFGSNFSNIVNSRMPSLGFGGGGRGDAPGGGFGGGGRGPR